MYTVGAGRCGPPINPIRCTAVFLLARAEHTSVEIGHYDVHSGQSAVNVTPPPSRITGGQRRETC